LVLVQLEAQLKSVYVVSAPKLVPVAQHTWPSGQLCGEQ
jgi:hypothetical protein